MLIPYKTGSFPLLHLSKLSGNLNIPRENENVHNVVEWKVEIMGLRL